MRTRLGASYDDGDARDDKTRTVEQTWLHPSDPLQRRGHTTEYSSLFSMKNDSQDGVVSIKMPYAYEPLFPLCSAFFFFFLSCYPFTPTSVDSFRFV